MAKQLFIDPREVRKKGWLKFKDIPLNQYDRTFEEVKKNFSKEDLINIYRDMVIIREFETMLYDIRTTGQYQGVQYTYIGPAHLSIGQEAVAVGEAYVLDKDDFIFGSHRSHGEVIAKALSCIRKMTEEELLEIMKSTLDGEILSVIEKTQRIEDDVKQLAVDFFLYGTLAEIFGRRTGFCKGLGGSMHVFFTPFGSYPNNAIVGGSATMAVGAALFKKINKKKGIVVLNIGDGAAGCGPVWEAISLSAMDQFKTLWEEEYRGGLPIVFAFINNQYAMGGQTSGETMGFQVLARLGAGVNPEQMYAERVDGFNPLAVLDAFKRKKEMMIQDKKGPVLLDIVTYRFTGHSPSDPETYRTKEELEAWKSLDPIETFGSGLVNSNVASKEELAEIRRTVKELIFKVFKLAIDDQLSPRLDLATDPDGIGKLMFSNQRIEKMDTRNCEVLIPKEENPRLKQIKDKVRVGVVDGKPVPKVKVYQLRDAIFEAILDKFYVDPTLIAYGEDNRDWGGAFGVYKGLTESLPYHRFFNTPISEAAIVGSAVGYAICGGKAIVEIMYMDFLGRAGDEVFNQLSKWQAMSGGKLKMPVVLRVSVGSKYGAQHSQDWSSIVAHIPGLKVVYPATPYDAKGLMNSALMGTDPVVFIESQKIYDIGEIFRPEGVPEGYYEVPIGEPDVKKIGTDITILTIGPALYQAVEAAKMLEEKYGIFAEIIDARSIVPFNYDTVIQSVKKTGKIVLVSEECERGSILNDFARNITELAFDYLDAPPVVIGSKNWITPPPELEKFFYPQADWILDAIHQKIMPLKGHTPVTDFSVERQLRLQKFGM